MQDAIQISANSGGDLPDLDALERMNLPLFSKLILQEANLPIWLIDCGICYLFFVRKFLMDLHANRCYHKSNRNLERRNILFFGFGIYRTTPIQLLEEVGFKGLAFGRLEKKFARSFANMDRLKINILEALNDDDFQANNKRFEI